MAIRTDPAPPRLLNRELSWLEYNARVLEIAEDDALPLLERIKFAAIFAQHLDEFFMVRVAGLLELDEAGLGVRSVDGLTASQALAKIRERVVELTARQARLWRRELRPSLAAAGIEIARIEDCTDKELRRLRGVLRARDLPRPDAARRRPRAAVPVHLRALAVASACSPRTRRRARSGSRA